MGILLPPKIYLDTNHLIGITKARKSVSPTAYSFIDAHLQEGTFRHHLQPGGSAGLGGWKSDYRIG